MKTNCILLITCITLSLLSCGESALSDVEIDDPSILKAYGLVNKKFDVGSTINASNDLTVRLMDKTEHSVSLLKGTVSCNGIEMREESNILGPYYIVPSDKATITANTTYTFTIELADGKKYTGSVFVDDGYLNTFNAPSAWTYSPTESLTVSWNEINKNYTTTISYTITYKAGADQTGVAAWGSYNVDGLTAYLFPNSYFKNSSGEMVVDKLTINLSSEKEGPMDSRFREGNTICKFDYYKVVDFQ